MLTFILSTAFVYPQDRCPPFNQAESEFVNNPYGVGYYSYAISLIRYGDDSSVTLAELMCEREVVLANRVILCKAGVYDAADNKGKALRCWAKTTKDK